MLRLTVEVVHHAPHDQTRGTGGQQQHDREREGPANVLREVLDDGRKEARRDHRGDRPAERATRGDDHAAREDGGDHGREDENDGTNVDLDVCREEPRLALHRSVQ